jgi:nitroreductase
LKKLIKRFVPVTTIRNALGWIDDKIIIVAAKNSVLAGVYYLFSGSFAREHLAVLAGRLAFASGFTNAAGLRRNIHRIEKGMIMRPRRAVFAEAYIIDTVEKYRICLYHNMLSDNEKCWAFDVLSHFFEIVDTSQSEIITLAHREFNEIEAAHYDVSKSVPYPRKNSVFSDIDFDDFYNLCQQRRSVRWYQDREVPISMIDNAIYAALQAPSACNRQPFDFVVIKDPEKARRLAGLAGGTAGYVQNIQSLVIVLGDLSAYPYERDRHVIYIDSGLASMQLMLALESQGLSSCAINWPDVPHREQKMADELNLPNYKRVIMLMSVGYADEDGLIPFSDKKTVGEVCQRLD